MLDSYGLLKRLVVEVGRRTVMPRSSFRVVVLCYHSIHSTSPFASASPELFEQHLVWLKEHCEIIRFSDVFEAAKDQRGSRPLVAITFDDGYADNYEHAFPLLLTYEAPATFFLTVGFIDKDRAVIERFQALRRARAGELRPLRWSQVREMRQAGIEFGAHSYSHPNLALLGRAAAEVELRQSKEIMEVRLGEGIRSMAYPFGRPKRDFTTETVTLVSEVGYEYAATTTSRTVRVSDSRLTIPRFFASGISVRTLNDMILGAWDLLGSWQERAPLFLQRGARRTL